MAITSLKTLRKQQQLHGFHQESLEFIDAMVKDGKEPVGAMGNDTAPAVFTDRRYALTDFKKQNFAQITNPSIHPYTEEDVMSLETSLGTLEGIDGEKTDKVILDTPIITSATFKELGQKYDVVEVDCTFDPSGTFKDFRNRIEEIKFQAKEVAHDGKQILLTNEYADDHKAPFELDMIGPAVHLYLLNKKLRGRTSLHGRALEVHTTHDIACLIGSGFDTVNPYLVEHTIVQRRAMGEYGDMLLEQCFENYFQASDFGLLTIMAKKGICTVESYRGAFEFEAFGFGPKYVEEFAPGMHSEIGGFELEDFYERAVRFHNIALDNIHGSKRLPHRGIHSVKQSEDAVNHANAGRHIQMLQEATRENDLDKFLEYSHAKRQFNIDSPTQIRDLWDLQYTKNPKEITQKDLGKVQSVESIIKQLGVASMSFGSTSPEQHSDTEEGARMVGAKWQSGEGGLPPDRKTKKWVGKGIQVASGRFGIDMEVISHATEIEIKIAQAAKGGEGGQLPGDKVNEEIAAARHCLPGTPLFSMGAHASIKSIEDLAQLVYGLKEANPEASVAVKTVAMAGIDTIAIGAIKNLADRVNISGVGGGTGAAKLTSQQHTGMPWELYLPKVHKMAIQQGFRKRTTLSVDGGISTPMDVVIANLLGAEEVYFGKVMMYVLGCRNMGVCNQNICAYGNATMDKGLRKNYVGKPEDVANFFTLMAKGVRRELAALGVDSLDELRGRVDLIKHTRMKDRNFDFSDQLTSFEGSNTKCTLKPSERNEYVDPKNPNKNSLDEAIYQNHRNEILEAVRTGKTWESNAISVSNENRNIGTRLSYYLTNQFSEVHRSDHTVTLHLEGMAGQQLGFLLTQGVTLKLAGAANDGVGEGNSGGIIAIYPMPGTRIFEYSYENSIVGNHAGYGMTAGQLYLAGRTGTNHAFRFSGGVEVNEGVGDNAYRFMTGGVGVCLGEVGTGLLAGAGGGTLFVYDPKDRLIERIDHKMIPAVRAGDCFNQKQIKVLAEAVEAHHFNTGSNRSGFLLKNWRRIQSKFKMVSPRKAQTEPIKPKHRHQSLVRLQGRSQQDEKLTLTQNSR